MSSPEDELLDLHLWLDELADADATELSPALRRRILARLPDEAEVVGTPAWHVPARWAACAASLLVFLLPTTEVSAAVSAQTDAWFGETGRSLREAMTTPELDATWAAASSEWSAAEPWLIGAGVLLAAAGAVVALRGRRG